MQPILIDGTWKSSTNELSSFNATDPSTGNTLEEREYPRSNWTDLETMAEAGYRASEELVSCPQSLLADFLDLYASKIEEAAKELSEIAHKETGLPIQPRLVDVEIPRTCDQLRQAAAARRNGSWSRPTIDSQNNIRSQYAPLGGPVLVIGPNNFPFAFNAISGGDFASAIAAGNPVIAKGHPSHPQTTQLLAEQALEAISDLGLPSATVQFFYDTTPDLGIRLVQHKYTAAVAFTGSRQAGLKLKAAADSAGKPIYLEMSSINPVFVMPGAIQERAQEIAEELHSSCTLGSGQFCTKPGLIVYLRDCQEDPFLEHLIQCFSRTQSGVLLNEGVLKSLEKSIETLKGSGANSLAQSQFSPCGYSTPSTLLNIAAQNFLKAPKALQTEAFGPVCLTVTAKSLEEILAIVNTLDGNLTGTIYSDTENVDDSNYDKLAGPLRQKVGRLINNKAPTGVAVTAAMNHGGPFPSSGHPGVTAVGFPASIVRFAALHSYDNVRQDRLPEGLKDKSPNPNMIRLIDGVWTCESVNKA